jgi:hypothetical protein
MVKIYSIKEVAEITGATVRTVQRKCKALNINKVNRLYQIDNNVLKQLVNDNATRHDNDIPQDNNVELIQEGFTPEEYEIFKKRLTDYPYLVDQVQDLKNQVEYFKKSLDKQSQIFERLTDSINNSLIGMRERNAIDYKKENDK